MTFLQEALFQSYLFGVFVWIAIDFVEIMGSAYHVWHAKNEQESAVYKKKTKDVADNLATTVIMAPFWPIALLASGVEIVFGLTNVSWFTKEEGYVSFAVRLLNALVALVFILIIAFAFTLLS